MHIRLVLLFSVVATTPTILVGVFATGWFSLGIQTWFNDRVRTALDDAACRPARATWRSTATLIRTDALGMKADLERAGPVFAAEPDAFGQMLTSQTTAARPGRGGDLRPRHGSVLASAGLMAGLGLGQKPDPARRHRSRARRARCRSWATPPAPRCARW